MNEKFIGFLSAILMAVSVIIGVILTVIGGVIEGWLGVGMIFAGQIIFVILLYLYNRKYK